MGSRLLDGSDSWRGEPNAHLFTEEQLAGVTLLKSSCCYYSNLSMHILLMIMILLEAL